MIRFEPVSSKSTAIAELIETASKFDDHAALGEHKFIELSHGGIIGLEALKEQSLIGYAQLSDHGDHFAVEVVVHPDHRDADLITELGRWAVESAAHNVLDWWVFRPTRLYEDVASQLGFTLGRELKQMRCTLTDLAPSWPRGFTSRAFTGRDINAWLETNNRAFEDHPEQGNWTRQTLELRMDEPWFDPAGLILATGEMGIAGFCWTKLHRESRWGEIYVIGVDPKNQKTGLGKALVLAGMQYAFEEGMEEMSLYVDSSNSAAVSLYSKLGYGVHHVDRAYRLAG